MILRDKANIDHSRFSLNVVSLIIEQDNHLLLLKRNDDKNEGGKWGPPAGKVESGETLVESIIRETQEETGIMFSTENASLIHTIPVKHGSRYFWYSSFRIKSLEEKKFEISIDPKEHQEFDWVHIDELSSKELVQDQDQVFKMVYKTRQEGR